MTKFSQGLSWGLAAMLLCAPPATGFEGFDEAVTARYPSASNLESCGTCHVDFSPGDTAFNPYGQAVNDVLTGFAIDQALADVESLDSDGDGTNNLDEIETAEGFFPGWTCETYTTAGNPPSDLADLVDPIDPGCDGTTTTTSTETSTSTSTSTTLPGDDQCSQPVSSGASPVATDCLFILNVAVGLQTCSPECICAPTGTLPAKATDALLCLNVSVGINLPLNCPCNGGTSTTVTSSTVTSTTVTSTSSTTEDSSTTTSTTTTTVGG